MKKLTLIALTIPLLILMSCSKEEIAPTSNTQNSTINYALPSVLDLLKKEKDLSIFHDAIMRTKTDIEIQGKGPYTIFAPNNLAFEKLFIKNNWTSLDDIPRDELTSFVQFHISKVDVKIADLTKGKYVPTLYQSRELFIDVDDPIVPKLIFGGTKANVTTQDHEQRNGMVNIVEGVLSL